MVNNINYNNESADSIRGRIRSDLLAGIRVTPLYGVFTHQSVDLRKRLSELRQSGMPISCEWEKNENTGKRYKVHYMTKDNIELWKQRNNN